MKSSDILIEKIKEFEDMRLESYKCPAGIWTIGIGHTKGVKKGQQITEAQAMTLLRGDLLSCETYVSNLGVCKTQGEFDSLVDFAFNLGTGKLASSTLLRKIRAGASESVIRKEFSRWVYSNGVKLDGLVKRRAWEADRFFGKEA